MATSIDIGVAPEGPQTLALKRANRHGLIAGATGTGKTVTLQLLAEEFAKNGVNVFAADIKGDLSGVAVAAPTPLPGWADARAKEIGATIIPEAQPVVFWDVYGELGHPVRTTITEMGPVLMASILDATDAQEGALTVAFKLADDRRQHGRNEKNEKEEQSGLLLDLKDLRTILTYISDNADDVGKKYGLVTPTTVAALQRKLLQLELDGADRFFGEKVLELSDLMPARTDGRGTINLLASERLVQSPKLYSAFLLWLMSELWEQLPEVGDPEKPKLVFFFDEAHLLFRDASKDLIQKVEQVVRLIRSKGVGIYFVTQSPTDVPDAVLAQLGNRIQHALRAYTPADQKAVKAAAASFRANASLDVARTLQELAVGEALVSTLDETGAPTPVARTKVRPPNSQVGALLLATRQQKIAESPLHDAYSKVIDRISAYEIAQQDLSPPPAPTPPLKKPTASESQNTPKASKTSKQTPVQRQPSGMVTMSEIGEGLGKLASRAATDVERVAVEYFRRSILGTSSRRRR